MSTVTSSELDFLYSVASPDVPVGHAARFRLQVGGGIDNPLRG